MPTQTLSPAVVFDLDGTLADTSGDLIAAAKIVVPKMAAKVIDRAIQVHGAKGFTGDTFLAKAYVSARFIQVGDGPDQVHMSSLARQLLRRHAPGSG